MRAWDIFSYQPHGWPEPHPAVVVSHPGRVANKPTVNVLMCTSKRANRSPGPNEVLLDENDGLDWPTLCRCDLLYLAQKTELTNLRGTVTAERKRAIIETINVANGWR